MASFRCYDNSNVIATPIITNFHLYLIQLWCQFFQIFVNGDVVYVQTCEVLTLKNYIEPPQARTFLSDARKPEVALFHFWAMVLPKFSVKSSL